MAKHFESQERLNNYVLDYPDAGNVTLIGMSVQSAIEAVSGKPGYAVVSGVVGLAFWVKTRMMRADAEEFLTSNSELSMHPAIISAESRTGILGRSTDFVQSRMIGLGYAMMGQGFYNEISGLVAGNTGQVVGGVITSISSIAVIATGMMLNPDERDPQFETQPAGAALDEL